VFTASEIGLGGLVVGLLGLGGGVFWGVHGKVPERQCDRRHKDLEKLFTVEFNAIKDSLEEVKREIRLGNGHK